MSFWRSIWTDQSRSWIYKRLPEGNVMDPADRIQSTEIPRDEAYISVWLESYRLTYRRRGFSKLSGLVYSFIEAGRLGHNDNIEFQVVSAPSALQNVDSKNLDKIINGRTRLLGPIPYRGGGLKISVGLFALKYRDLLDELLETAQSLSSIAGVEFVSQVTQFARPIGEAMRRLTGANDSTSLEIGIVDQIETPTTGYVFAVAAEESELSSDNIFFNQDRCLVNEDKGRIGRYPYFVLSIRREAHRETWYQIPELSRAYKLVRDSIEDRDMQDVEAAVRVFRKTALLSPDLIRSDAIQIASRVEEETTLIMKAVHVAHRTSVSLPDAVDLGVFSTNPIHPH